MIFFLLSIAKEILNGQNVKYLLLLTEVPDLLQAGIPRDGLQCTEHLKYMGTTCGGAVVLNDLEEFHWQITDPTIV